MIKYKKILGGGGVKINKTFIVCGCCVRFTFQIKICEIFFGRLHEVEKDEIFYNEGWIILLKLFKYYMNVDEYVEVVHNVGTSRNEQSINVDSTVVDDMLDDLTS